MANPSWFDILENNLRTQRVPGRYRRRTVRELRDHAEDILHHGDHQNLSETEQEALLTRRLGDAQHLAATFVHTYRQRFFAGRHPIVTFLLGPIPLGLAIWSLAVGSLSLPIWLARACGANVYTDPWARYLNLVVWVGFNLVPVGIAMLFAWLAQHSAVSRIATICSTALLALVFGCLRGKIQLPVEGPGTGMLLLGISSDLEAVRSISMIAAVGALILIRRYYQERRTLA